jgi:hypothetical protein
MQDDSGAQSRIGKCAGDGGNCIVGYRYQDVTHQSRHSVNANCFAGTDKTDGFPRFPERPPRHRDNPKAAAVEQSTQGFRNASSANNAECARIV